METCSLSARLEPSQAPRGATARLQVRVSDTNRVHGVRVSIVGYGLEESLTREDDIWTLQTMVPYEAGPGEYLLEIYAVNAEGQRCGSVNETFTVTG